MPAMHHHNERGVSTLLPVWPARPAGDPHRGPRRHVPCAAFRMNDRQLKQAACEASEAATRSLNARWPASSLKPQAL